MHMSHLQNSKKNAEITADTRDTITDIQVRNLVLKVFSCSLLCNDYTCTYLPIWNIWHQPSLNNLRNSCTWNQSCMSPLRLNVHSPLHHSWCNLFFFPIRTTQVSCTALSQQGPRPLTPHRECPHLIKTTFSMPAFASIAPKQRTYHFTPPSRSLKPPRRTTMLPTSQSSFSEEVLPPGGHFCSLQQIMQLLIHLQPLHGTLCAQARRR